MARYKGLKGTLWRVFSEHTRKRDYYTFGTCITCAEKISNWNVKVDAGHFMNAGNSGFALLFDERNVNAECKSCNGFNRNHQLLYAQNLNKRYGEGTADSLVERYKDYHFKGVITKEWTAEEYKERIKYYKTKIKEFDNVKKDLPL